ncbi:DUF6527 family protein [Gramella sp. AN32]|uniref:DUF6527 family protein n=1 Tax=Christiangramia antarctica TaxID=2058158 RepID=A0ABW5WZE4_9FLAO|nr:DUF6527 family protein [Gramella sp. AN32]MCM4156824.1 hypothetical protein [Gramella sp. AN32]
MEKIKLLKVKYLPKDLEQEILYVSEEFGIAGHLCPCGCKNKIMTPLDPSEWSFKEVNNIPTLYPSIGNWQLPCRSHYWITDGNIKWSYDWNENEIIAGREVEAKKREAYYNNLEIKQAKKSVLRRILDWFSKLLSN